MIGEGEGVTGVTTSGTGASSCCRGGKFGRGGAVFNGFGLLSSAELFLGDVPLRLVLGVLLVVVLGRDACLLGAGDFGWIVVVVLPVFTGGGESEITGAGEFSSAGGGVTGGGGNSFGEAVGGLGGTKVGVGAGGTWVSSGASSLVGEFFSAAGAAASCLVLDCSSNLTPAVVKPTANTTAAAALAQGGRGVAPDLLRVGNATTSMAYWSRAVARSNSCNTVNSTTGPDSWVAS